MYTSVTVTGIRGLPLIQKGDDLPGLIVERCALEEGDIICVASTIISKAKGYTRHLKEITPGDRAKRIADMTGEDPRFIRSLDRADVLIRDPVYALLEVPGPAVGSKIRSRCKQC